MYQKKKKKRLVSKQQIWFVENGQLEQSILVVEVSFVKEPETSICYRSRSKMFLNRSEHFYFTFNNCLPKKTFQFLLYHRKMSSNKETPKRTQSFYAGCDTEEKRKRRRMGNTESVKKHRERKKAEAKKSQIQDLFNKNLKELEALLNPERLKNGSSAQNSQN